MASDIWTPASGLGRGGRPVDVTTFAAARPTLAASTAPPHNRAIRPSGRLPAPSAGPGRHSAAADRANAYRRSCGMTAPPITPEPARQIRDGHPTPPAADVGQCGAFRLVPV